MDAVVIMGASPRPIRFVMDHRIFKIPVLSWIFRTAKVIPIAPAKEDPVIFARAFEEIAQVLAEGELVCIFPEGRLTSDGEMSVFKAGVQKIIERTPVPVIPMALRGLWGTFFSRHGGNSFERTFRRGPRSQLSLVVGLPMAPENATPEVLQAQVQALRGPHQ